MLKFPQGFLWGTGTSAYQIEGAVKEDGRGESIWDRFCGAGRCYGDTGAVADDHYHRWEQDLDLMKELNLQTYRFSIAWPRILPTGEGQVNQKGLDFYKRLVEGLHKRNITPMATLYHWDLPQALEEKGGWPTRDTAQRFAEYAKVVFSALQDQVPMWATINEPWVTANVGYTWGSHAPGRKNAQDGRKAIHHQLLGHGLAVQAFRAQSSSNSQIGIVLNTAPIYPASSSSDDAKAAQIEDGTRNRVYLDPVFKGSYPQDVLDSWKKDGTDLSFIQADDLKTINAPINFLGLNYYNPVYKKMGPFSQPQDVTGLHPHAFLDWEEIYPQGLYDHLMRLKKDYGNPTIYVTENGAAFVDKLETDGQVNDTERLKYLHDHFASAQRAIADGVNLKGYYVWSLLDNFEWAEGYRARFGIVYVDYTTQKRYPKRSALWYRDVIKQNGVGALPTDIK
ncbi:MAG TPA: GH1 family beta-glucosidase [Chloroflexia bacterium]|nr:GH1 family beta-glucosidase [Chloroflexia bacterium]